MTIYLFLLGYILILGAIIYKKKPYNQNANKIFVVCTFFVMFLIASLRGKSVGWDTYNYVVAFEYGVKELYLRNWEPLFLLLLSMTRKITSNPQWFLAICSLIALLGNAYFILANSTEEESSFWSIFLFVVLVFYFNTMNIIRQSIAMSFGCNVYTVLRKGLSRKRIIISLILVIIATLFHKTGIVCLLLFIPFIVRPNRKNVFFCYCSGILVFFLFPFFLNLLFRIFPIYRRYLYVTEGNATHYYLIAIIEIIIAILFFIYINPENKKNQDSYRLLFIIAYSFVMIMAQNRIALAQRFGYYFEIFLILIIPEFMNRLYSAKARVMLKTTVFFLGFFYFLRVLNGVGRGCVPYSFFWQ